MDEPCISGLKYLFLSKVNSKQRETLFRPLVQPSEVGLWTLWETWSVRSRLDLGCFRGSGVRESGRLSRSSVPGSRRETGSPDTREDDEGFCSGSCL